MPIPPEEPIVFTEPENIKKFGAIGYKRHFIAGIGLGKDAIENNTYNSVLLAGYPGTGKTAYSYMLARRLEIPHLYIKGNSLMDLGSIDEIRRRLKRTREQYLTGDPLVIAYDELDLLAPIREIRPIEETKLAGAIMDMLDRKPIKTVIPKT
ncbi:AAA family ATPase [archaeon]|nr:AAA family ATPase [archaeon]